MDYGYSHSKNGASTGGSLKFLMKSIREGKSVRIFMDHGKSEYFELAENVVIQNGMVYAQMSSRISIDWSGTTMRFNPRKAYKQYKVVSTQGHRSVMRFSLEGNKHLKTTNDRCPMKWFVDE